MAARKVAIIVSPVIFLLALLKSASRKSRLFISMAAMLPYKSAFAYTAFWRMWDAAAGEAGL
jgi:hypothetical protein